MSGTEDLAKTIKKMVREDRGAEPTGYTTSAEVIRVDGDTAWVHIPGPEAETPVHLTMAARTGDEVQVRVAGGKAWIIGNETSPPTDDGTANAAMTKIAEADVIIAKKANISDLQATKARIGELEADTAKIHDLTAEELTASVGYIGDLTAAEISAQDLSAASGYIKDLEADSITAAKVSAAAGYYSELDADHITASDISAAAGYIDRLESEQITTADIKAATGYVDNLEAGSVTAANLIADHGTVGSLNVNYAKINAANITESATQQAWINQLLVQTGLLAQSGTIYTLDAIQVNASNITAGTIDVERLIVTVGGEKYLVHIDPTTHQPTYEKLDGDVIEDLTITADKIVAGAITAEKITTQNLIGTSGWINLHQGTFFYGDGADWASCTQGIKWDGTDLLVKGNLTVTAGSNVYSKAEADAMNLDASKVATNYLTFSSANGLDVGASGIQSKVNIKSDGTRIYDEAGRVGNYLNSEGMSIYRANQNVAFFGENVRIGEEGKASLLMTDTSLELSAGANVTSFRIKQESQQTVQKQGSSMGEFEKNETRTFSILGLVLDATHPMDFYPKWSGTPLRITATGTYTSGLWTVVVSTSSIKITALVAGFHMCRWDYYGAGATAAYILGQTTNENFGDLSFTEGLQNIASGNSSHAEGSNNTASGSSSHAEGSRNTASDTAAHAEGQDSSATKLAAHAEGSSTASGYYSHAEGVSTASANYSHAQNHNCVASGNSATACGDGTTAAYYGQTVIGYYNKNVSGHIFEIGNGENTDHRNAFTVDGDGNVELWLWTNTSSGTDHDLYAAITALGWQSTVID